MIIAEKEILPKIVLAKIAWLEVFFKAKRSGANHILKLGEIQGGVIAANDH